MVAGAMSIDADLHLPVELSICIPTYNFGEFIEETLASIMPQVIDGVEVVVLDGGSSDQTPAVVRSLQARFPALRYHRREQRGGIDRDMAHTVELARGAYCWLFSADDTMKPGAVARMLGHIRGGLDVYLCGLTLCTCDMRPLKDHPILEIESETVFDLGRGDDRRAYFERAATTTAFFSFLGSVIFKKARWDEIPLNEGFVGSCWAHVARMFQMIPAGLRVKYLPEAYLWKRCDNDSFMGDGLIRRFAITIDGYHRLAEAFFAPDSVEARHIRRVVTAEFPPYILAYAKLTSRYAGGEDRRLLERLVATVYAEDSVRHRTYRSILKGVPALPFRAPAAHV
jgi:abequosyltransferase